MKKLITLILSSILGGVIALGAYVFYFQENTSIIEVKQTVERPSIIKTNNNIGNVSNNNLDFTKAAKQTVDAVVHVKNTSVRTVRDPYAEMYYGRGYGAKKYAQVGTGSGVVISSDGYIITNNHVIKGATEIQITLNNKKVYTA
ncbi:MAG TPA: serine protease, partial [Flavobacteriaceae bacterium]|nr:serine protease [Flavobacteriaceae bacterium]